MAAVPPCAEQSHGYSCRMRSGWGGLIAFFVLGLWAADAPPSAAPRVRAIVAGDGQPRLSRPLRASAPAEDDDARDVNDDDSDDDASLTSAVAMEAPRPQRLGYRAAASSLRTPPDARELLRPPQLGVD